MPGRWHEVEPVEQRLGALDQADPAGVEQRLDAVEERQVRFGRLVGRATRRIVGVAGSA